MTRSSQLWMLVWPFFSNKSSLKILFVSFWGWSYNMLGDFYPSKCYITKKGPKKLSDFECCAVLTHSTQFQWLVWPIFGSKTCLRTLFRGYWGWSFDFWIDICLFNILYYQEIAQKAVRFWILCSFFPFCTIPRACLAIFWRLNMFKDSF